MSENCALVFWHVDKSSSLYYVLEYRWQNYYANN